jgi:hypothetical protein
VGFEIFLGFGLLLGGHRKVLSMVSFYFLLFLSIGYVWGYSFRNVTDCGCFGEILKLSPLGTLLKNAIMLLGSWIVWHGRDSVIKKRWSLAVAIVFGLITIFVNGYEFKLGISSDIELSKLNVKTSFLSPHIHAEEQIIFIFNPLCTPCKNVGIELNNSKTPVIGLYANVFSEANFQSYKEVVHPNFPIYTVSVNSLQKHIFTYPTLLYIKNKKIHHILHTFKP